MSYIINILKFTKNSTLSLILSRYISFGLQLVQGIILAKALGPNNFGIWGFILLVLTYLSFSSLGLQYAITVCLSTESNDDKLLQNKRVSVAITSTYIIVFILVILSLLLHEVNLKIFEKFNFNRYIILVSIVSGLNLCLELFKNIYRVYNKLIKIAFAELLRATLLLIVVFIFKNEALIYSLLWVFIITGVINVIIFHLNAPFKYSLFFDTKLVTEQLRLGIPLLIYGISFYLILISSKTIVSYYYSLDIMGYYSFANSITNAILLGLNTIAWVFYPNTLAKTQFGLSNEAVIASVSKINILYGTSVFIAVFTSMLLLPLLFCFLPQYRPVEITLNILLLSQAVLAMSFGSNSLAVARKKQLKVALISIVSVCIVVILSLICAAVQFSIEWIAMSVFTGSVVFTYRLAKFSSSLLDHKLFSKSSLENVFNWGVLLSIFICVAGNLIRYPLSATIIAFIIYIISNRNKIKFLFEFINSKTLLKIRSASIPPIVS